MNTPDQPPSVPSSGKRLHGEPSLRIVPVEAAMSPGMVGQRHDRKHPPGFTDLKVICTTFADGERCSLLVDAATGVPLFEPNFWALTAHRRDSASDQEQALRGAMLVHLWAALEDIALHERIRSGAFFSAAELNALEAAAMSKKRHLSGMLIARDRGASPPTHDATSRSPESFREMRPLARTSPSERCKWNTKNIRLHYAAKYIRHLADKEAFRLGINCTNAVDALSTTRWHEDRRDRCIKSILSRVGGSDDAEQFQLSDAGYDHLLQSIHPDSADNPWTSQFVRVRNRTLILTLLGTGMRKGEGLSLKVKDIDFGARHITIRRTHDDPKDRRKRQPLAKRGTRMVPLDTEVALALRDYIKARSSIFGARKHGYLFVSRSGSPLSLSEYTEIFLALRPLHPDLNGMKGHTLRHKWNELFSEDADASGLSEEAEKRIRREVAGWTPNSKMPDHYNKRRTRRQGAEASSRIQQLIMNKATSIQDAPPKRISDDDFKCN